MAAATSKMKRFVKYFRFQRKAQRKKIEEYRIQVGKQKCITTFKYGEVYRIYVATRSKIN